MALIAGFDADGFDAKGFCSGELACVDFAGDAFAEGDLAASAFAEGAFAKDALVAGAAIAATAGFADGDFTAALAPLKDPAPVEAEAGRAEIELADATAFAAGTRFWVAIGFADGLLASPTFSSFARAAGLAFAAGALTGFSLRVRASDCETSSRSTFVDAVVGEGAVGEGAVGEGAVGEGAVDAGAVDTGAVDAGAVGTAQARVGTAAVSETRERTSR